MTTKVKRGDVLNGECHACGYFARIKAYPTNKPRTPLMGLCMLCASTVSGNAHNRPQQYPNASTLHTLCFIGNALLAAVNPSWAVDLEKVTAYHEAESEDREWPGEEDDA